MSLVGTETKNLSSLWNLFHLFPVTYVVLKLPSTSIQKEEI